MGIQTIERFHRQALCNLSEGTFAIGQASVGAGSDASAQHAMAAEHAANEARMSRWSSRFAGPDGWGAPRREQLGAHEHAAGQR